MVWILESNRIPVEVEILKKTRDFITVRPLGTEDDIRLKSSRVFSRKEEALKSIKMFAIVVDPIVGHLAINFVRFRRFDLQEN